ncbi:MAG: nucleotidyltransferase family protein, partial [Lachnospiraceae bacterium]|nr:nucleotidyltransferase family protein [Lachnospiraceae bacterium]
EPEEYKEKLKLYLKTGLSFPQARTNALTSFLKNDVDSLEEIISCPNNILGIEYIKALIRRNSAIKPISLYRKNSGHNESSVDDGDACSSLSIRNAIKNNNEISPLMTKMQQNSLIALFEAVSKNNILYADNISNELLYKLLISNEEGYDKYLDVSQDLSCKISKELENFVSFSQFCDILKSKDLTYTRISRSLMHILLNITKEKAEYYKENDYIRFARVLGFKKEASPLLSAIERDSSIPLITKLSDARSELDDTAYSMFSDDIFANRIYNATMSLKNKKSPDNEFRTPLVIVD